MKLVVGLGNPGMKYQATRHNAGFMVIDRVTAYYKIKVSKEERKSLVGSGRVGGEKVIFAKPQTFMNKSGEAVRALADYYNIETEEIIIIYDDLDLEPGQIKVKPKGGAGGHNGIKSIINHLGTNQFPRIRVGIGRPDRAKVVDYVLNKFSKVEKKKIKNALDDATDAAKLYLEGDLDKAMNRYN